MMTTGACGLLFAGQAIGGEPVTWSKVVDFGDAGYQEVGASWKNYTNPQANNYSYRYLSHWREQGLDIKRVGLAFWRTEIPYSGTYRISVSYRRTENRSPDADYGVLKSDASDADYNTIFNKAEYDWTSINQQGHLALIWKDLGVYEYKKGQLAVVILDGTDDTHSDCADAAKWELVELSDPSVNTGANSLLLRTAQ